MVQKTNYPWDGKVGITVNPQAATRFTVRVRAPQRDVSTLYTSAPSADGFISCAVNGRRMRPSIERGYAVITRTWKPGDRIDLELPMRVQRVRASDKIEADRGRVALRYGPLLYNIEKVDVQDIDKALAANAPLTTEWRSDLLGGVMIIKGTFTDGSPFLAVPNFARMNREPVPPPQSVAQATVAAGPRERPPLLPIGSVVWINET